MSVCLPLQSDKGPVLRRAPMNLIDQGALILVLETIRDGVYVVDAQGRIAFWNRGAEQLSGYTSDEVLGRCCHDDLLSYVDEAGLSLCHSGCPLVAGNGGLQHRGADVYLRHKAGHRVPVHLETTAMLDDDNRVIGAVETFSDNSQMISTQKAIRTLASLALNDPLTALPNRRSLDIRLNGWLQESITSGEPLSMMMLDIDHFKKINDRYGHDIGDRAIQTIAATLKKCLSGSSFAGRWGGEEFVILMGGLQLADACKAANRIRMLIENSEITTHVGLLHITASIGVAQAKPSDSPISLQARADKGLYASKKAGRNRVTAAE